MRKIHLFIRVFLLLTAFVGSSSNHAANYGDHNLLDNSITDFNIALGNQITEGDEELAPSSTSTVFSFLPAVEILDYVPAFSQGFINKPHARAPPVNTSV